MKPTLLIACATAMALTAGALPASAQTHQCGDIQLIFKNPDLQPGEDGFIRASGQFFVQFQAIGAGADQIKVFGFSFGPDTVDFSESACTAPAWVTGTYLPNYRADRDPQDGFFIPIKTMLVPDGTYAAAVHAYDANNNELARFWARAIVANCDNQTVSAQEKCDDDPEQLQRHDRVGPWPIILPGDGQTLPGRKLTIEFGEELANLTVYLNGVDITAELRGWEGRVWDADYSPDYGPGGASGAVAPPCSQPHHTCETYGPAYEWTGRDLTAADFIRVEAYDVAGNRAVKDVHVGSSVAGGAVTAEIPILNVQAESTRATVAPGAEAAFLFRISNDGNGAGHPSSDATVPPGWTHRFDPVHVPVDPGQSKEQTLYVKAGTTEGTFAVNATFSYQAGPEIKRLTVPLQVTVGAAPGGGTTSTSAPTGEESAPLPLAPAIVALGALAWTRRRRAGARARTERRL
jgi:hypothetical protein